MFLFVTKSEHGTHVAGIIASGKSSRILPIYTNHEFSDVLDKIDVAIQNNAKIINMSFHIEPSEYDFPRNEDGLVKRDRSKTERNQLANEKLKKVFGSNSDILFISSAGNKKNDLSVNPQYPAGARSDNHIVVASVNKDGELAHSSSYSDELVDFAAIGVDVKSAFPNESYGTMSGTSMAAPTVTRIASKMLKINPHLTPAMIKGILCETVDKRTELLSKTRCGGIVNKSKALEKVHTLRASQGF